MDAGGGGGRFFLKWYLRATCSERFRETRMTRIHADDRGFFTERYFESDLLRAIQGNTDDSDERGVSRIFHRVVFESELLGAIQGNADDTDSRG